MSQQLKVYVTAHSLQLYKWIKDKDKEITISAKHTIRWYKAAGGGFYYFFFIQAMFDFSPDQNPGSPSWGVSSRRLAE